MRTIPEVHSALDAVLSEDAQRDAKVLHENAEPKFNTLGDRLDYQCAVNAILLRKSDRVAPLLTVDEMRELEEAYEAGDSPAEFAQTIIERDARAQEKAANMNADDGPSDEHYRESMKAAGRGHLLR